MAKAEVEIEMRKRGAGVWGEERRTGEGREMGEW